MDLTAVLLQGLSNQKLKKIITGVQSVILPVRSTLWDIFRQDIELHMSVTMALYIIAKRPSVCLYSVCPSVQLFLWSGASYEVVQTLEKSNNFIWKIRHRLHRHLTHT
jgi:hypothetical protein